MLFSQNPMKNKLVISLLGIELFFSLGSAKDFTVSFDPYQSFPRIIYAFGSRDQKDRYLLQSLRTGIGTKRPDDPQGTSRMLDTLWRAYATYDTTAAYNAVMKRDEYYLTSNLTRLTAQMFILDIEKFRSIVAENNCNLDSVDTVKMRWKGTVINRKKNYEYAVFWLAHVGHLFFVAKDTTVDSLSMDTSAVILRRPNYWLSSVGFCKYEMGVSIEFDSFDTAGSEIRTDYFALNFHFNEPATAVSKNPVSTPKKGDLRFVRTPAGGGRIEYRLDNKLPARMSIHSLSGELIYRSGESARSAGLQSWFWDGRDKTGRSVSPGAYVVTAGNDQKSTARRTIIIR